MDYGVGSDLLVNFINDKELKKVRFLLDFLAVSHSLARHGLILSM
ncbi:outer membrane protein 12 fragment 4 [Helicobacter acinonychis str. Sheeba]|uniref:Outer membrane protein 12 4 n=1 Tax=Helicobacter acinonychis (strain Sheeba) TaxID=382638 RepID=Q17XA8_HELAH|nr:outer membrane protein 12 fragment 4 [Helicobacter acinonychis str. Sheeba]